MALLQFGDHLDQVLEGAAQAVQAPDDGGIAGTDIGARLCKAGTSAVAPLSVSVNTLTAGSLECILLKGERLLVGGDTCIANQQRPT